MSDEVETPYAILKDFLLEAKKARLAEQSLIEFTKQAWEIIEPGVAFRDNWHLHAIAEHLEAVSRGEIQNIVIAIPPGCMKSILVSVAWPAWEWIRNPALRYMGASYGIDLAIRDSMKCRDIITSDWYTDRWPGVEIRSGDDQKTKYSLTGGGWRMATSVGGRATGEHPDRKIVDDPHNAKQAESDAERENAVVWFDRTLSTRGKSRGARTVVVAQRFHEKDVSGHILADIGGYDYLCIPMEFEERKPATSIGWVDPRKQKGDLLWPEMFDDQSVADLKKLLGAYGASGQLQQEPAPVDAGLLNIEHIKKWPHDKPKPQLQFVMQSYDTAFSEKEVNDPSACTVWGFFHYEGERHVMLLDAWDEHLSYPDLRQRLIDDWSSEYGGDSGPRRGQPIKPRKPDRVLIEAKASGQSLIQDLRRAGVPVLGYNPGKADKIARAHQAAPVLELGVVWIPESKKTPGEYVSWAKPLLKQMQRFPVAEHDDLVDTFTQAIIYAKDNGLIALPRADGREELPRRRPDEVRTNPYAA